MPYERPVAVYIPAQYVPGTEAPFMVVQDGYNMKYHQTVPTILDKLIADKRFADADDIEPIPGLTAWTDSFNNLFKVVR